MKKIIAITGICGALVVPAMAAEDAGKPKRPGGPDGAGRPSPEQMFGRLDADKSGGISLEEYKNNPRAKSAPDQSKVEERFNLIDADKDGSLSEKEFVAAMKKMAERGGPGAPGKPGEGRERPKSPDSAN